MLGYINTYVHNVERRASALFWSARPKNERVARECFRMRRNFGSYFLRMLLARLNFRMGLFHRAATPLSFSLSLSLSAPIHSAFLSNCEVANGFLLHNNYIKYMKFENVKVQNTQNVMQKYRLCIKMCVIRR